MTNPAARSGRPWQPPWHQVYFLLAAFDVFAVSMSLYFNHRIMTIYTQSVAVGRAWAELQHGASELGQLAAAVNAPGNDVFASRDVAREAEKMAVARRAFDRHLETVRAMTREQTAESQAGPLLHELDQAGAAVGRVAAEADAIFEALRTNRVDEAGKRMAAMDRQYEQALAALTHLRERIAAIQQAHFDQQTTAAAVFQWSEYVIAGLILFMVAGALLYGRQVGQQAEAYLRRQREAEFRTRFLRQVMAAQEEERRRIARDLHDEIGQSLTSLIVGLRVLTESPAVGGMQGNAAALRDIAAATYDEVRRLARGLRPSVLDDLGLVPALERHILDYAEAHAVAADFESEGFGTARLPEAVETALYRIVQEALTNTAKHAAAGHVHVTLSRDNVTVRLVVEDDGRGFDAAAPRADGVGLSGIHERAALLGGSVHITSRPGQGTRLDVRVPAPEVPYGEDTDPDRG